jgi:hypothetical protein
MLPSYSSHIKAVYNPKAFILHAALLHQAFAHCGKFPTAASRRSLGRVSVPVWLIILSDQLLIIALVSFYLTNKLIKRRPFPKRRSFNPWTTCGIRHHFWCLSLTLGYVPTRYSAVRRSSAKSKLFLLPLDLHVLGTPPAFILSQDQTLHKKNLPTSVEHQSCD